MVISDPIILWWHQTGTESFNYYKTCGTNRCYFTESRKHQHDTRTKVNYEHGVGMEIFSGVRVTRSLVLYVCFVDSCLSFCAFSFDHCVVCSSIYVF